MTSAVRAGRAGSPDVDIEITRAAVAPDGPEPGTFAHELSRALDDVRRALAARS